MMIRVYDTSGNLLSSDTQDALLWDVTSKIKRSHGIPRGEQTYVIGEETLSKSSTLTGPMEITLVQARIRCSGCGKAQQKRKYQTCGNCRDAYYCNKSCQSEHWKCHKKMCRAAQKEERVEHEHDYKRVFPNGPRDNNEFDLVCNVCGHVA